MSEMSTASKEFEEISSSTVVRAVALKQLTVVQTPPVNELLDCGKDENKKLSVVSHSLSCFMLGLR
jgi:hypothetical protein